MAREGFDPIGKLIVSPGRVVKGGEAHKTLLFAAPADRPLFLIWTFQIVSEPRGYRRSPFQIGK